MSDNTATSSHHIDVNTKEDNSDSSIPLVSHTTLSSGKVTMKPRKKKPTTDQWTRGSGLPLSALLGPIKRIGPRGSLILLVLAVWIIFYLYLLGTRSSNNTSFKLPSFTSFFSSTTTTSATSFDSPHTSTRRLRPYVMEASLEAASGVSVIVSVHHEWNVLARSLPNWLENLATQLNEIIIVDWSSRSRNQLIPARGNEELLSRDFQQLLNDTRIKVVQLYGSAGTSEYLLPVALNLAASIATSKSLLHLTPDTLILDRSFLSSYSLETDVGVFWRGDTSTLEHIDLETLAYSQKDSKKNNQLPFFYTHRFNSNFIVSRRHYWQVGGLDERFVSHSQHAASSVSGLQMDSLPSSSSTSSSFSSSDWSLGSSGGFEILEFYERLSGLTEKGALPSMADDEPILTQPSGSISNEGDDFIPIRMKSFSLKSFTQLPSYPYILSTIDREWNPGQVVLENVYRLCASTLPRWHERLRHTQQGASYVQVSGYEGATFLKRTDPRQKRTLHAFLQPGSAVGTAMIDANGFNSFGAIPSAIVPTLPFHDLIPPSLQERFLLLSLHQFLFRNLGIPKKILKKIPMDRLKRISKILDVLPLVEREQMTQRSNAETKPDEPSSANRHILPVAIIQPKLLVLHVFGTVSDRLIALESLIYLFKLHHLAGTNRGGENATTSTNLYPPRELVVIWPTFPSSGCTTPFHFLLESHNFSILQEYDEFMFSPTKFDIYEFDSPDSSYANRQGPFSNSRDEPIDYPPFPYNQFDLSTEKHIYIRTDGALTLAQPGAIRQHEQRMLESAKNSVKSSKGTRSERGSSSSKLDIKKLLQNLPKPSPPPAADPNPPSSTRHNHGAHFPPSSVKTKSRAGKKSPAQRELKSFEAASPHIHEGHTHSTSIPSNQHWHLTHLLPHRQVRKYYTHALLSIGGVNLPLSNDEDLFLNASLYKNHHPFGSQRTRLEQNAIQEEWQIWEGILNEMHEKTLIGIHLDCIEAPNLQHHHSPHTQEHHVHESARVQVTNEPLRPDSFASSRSTHSHTEQDSELLKWVLSEMSYEISQDSSVVFYVTSFNASSTLLSGLSAVYGPDRLLSVDLDGARCHQDEDVQNKWQLKWHQIRCSQLQLAEALVLRHSKLILTNAPEDHGFINLARRITLSSPHDITHLSPVTTTQPSSHATSHHHRIHSHPIPIVRRMQMDDQTD